MNTSFKESEIIGYLEIDGKKVTYLKMGVRKRFKYRDTLDYDNISQLNRELLTIELWRKLAHKLGVNEINPDISLTP